MYKMLVLDMDGTLLNERQEITEGNLSAIKEIIRKGIKVVIATGRPYSGVIPYLKKLGLYKKGCHTITCSGALVIENVTEEILYEKHILTEDLVKIHGMCETLDIDMSGYTKTDMVIHHENLFSRFDALANDTKLRIVDFENLNPEDTIFKLNIINESVADRDNMIRYFPALKVENTHMREKPKYNPNLLSELWHFPKDILDNYTVVRPLPFCLELLDKDSNKAVGVEMVAKEYGIDISEIVCIGDSGNDVHMLEEAGLGIAMANASDAAKAVADEITLSNEEDGVAFSIGKHFLK